jgi:hypothetical protein
MASRARARRRTAPLVALTSLLGTVTLLISAPGARRAAASQPSTATVTLSASASPATVGAALTLTATVTGSSPTGSVTFLDDGSPLTCGASGTEALSTSASTATCVVASMPGPSGVQSLTALYLGDSANLPAYDSIEEQVNALATTTTLQLSSQTASSLTYTASASAAGAPVASGTFSFSVDGTPISSCTNLSVSSGSATCTISAPTQPTSNVLEAAFSPTNPKGDLAPSVASVIEGSIASAGVSSTQLTVSSPQAAVGSTVMLGAVVTDDASATAPPEGTITFTDGANALPGCTNLALTYASGTAQAGAACNLSGGFSTAGAQDLMALFTPATASGLAASASTPQLVAVPAGSAAVEVTASPDPAPGGAPVTLQVSVTNDATQSPATGSVQLLVGGQPASCTTATSGLVSLSSGTATCTLTSVSAGSTLVTAAYLGNATLQPTTAVAPLTVDPTLAPVNVTVTSNANPITTGQSVTYTATLSSSAQSPSGTVAFTANGNPIPGCAAVTVSAGAATCTVSGYASNGQVVVTATYGGDATHLAAAGALTEIVGSAPSGVVSLTLNGPTTPVPINFPVQFQALVTGASSAPTGTVTFNDDGTVISSCSGITLAQIGSSDTSQASCSLPSGYSTDLSHTVVASYSGDSSYPPASGALVITVAHDFANLAPSVTPLPPSLLSAPIFALSLSGTAGIPTGSVLFAFGDGFASSCLEGEPITVQNGLAICESSSTLTAPQYEVTYSYGGDDSYSPEVSALADETVATGVAPASVSLTASPSSPNVGSDLRFEVAVSGQTGVPTGTVTLTDNGTPLSACGNIGTLALTSGTANCDAGTSLAAGIHDVVASYSGDSTYAPAASLLAQEVLPAPASSSGAGVSPGGSGGPGGFSATGGPGGSSASASASAGMGGAGGSTRSPSVGPEQPTGSSAGGSSTGPTNSGSGKGIAKPPIGTGDGGTLHGSPPNARHDLLTVSAPRTTFPYHPIVLRAQLNLPKGQGGGTTTFFVNGRRVHGCTQIHLSTYRFLHVDCQLPGFAAAGNVIVSVEYENPAHRITRTATAIERVLPTWQGYWLVTESGRVSRAGNPPALPSVPMPRPVVAAEMTPNALGLLVLGRDGTVRALGDANAEGSGPPYQAPYVGLATTFDGRGYWLLSRSGEVFAYGDAPPLGSARATNDTGPFVAIASTPDGRGYWLLSERGVVVARGDAKLWPRRGPVPSSAPYVALTSSSDGQGYLLLTSTGRLVAYGDAPAVPLQPIRAPKGAGHFVGLLPYDSGGFLLATSRGRVIAVGHSPAIVTPPIEPGAPTAAIAGT